MTMFLVTCTKIYNGTMFVDAENNEEALDIAQNKLNENVDSINWYFGEATADIADEEESRLDPNYKPKYHVGEYIFWHHYDDKTCTEKDDIFQITDIKDGKYICSDGKEDTCDFLDYDKDFRIATDDEVRVYNNLPQPKYKVGDFIVSECGTIYKVTNVENDKYDAENKIGDEETAITFFVDDKKYRLATDEEIKKYNNQSRPKYKVGDIVKSDNSPADKIVSVNSETYFFESGEQSDITVLDDDANFYLVQLPKYKVGEYVGSIDCPYDKITEIRDGKYIFESGAEANITYLDDNGDFSKKEYTFEKTDLMPFDKVLVRDDESCTWIADFFSHILTNNNGYQYVTCGGICWEQCVPYNSETAHLLGTTADYNGKYKTW